MIKVLVAGALGRMGSEVCKKVCSEAELELVGGVDIKAATITPADCVSVEVTTDIEAAVKALKPDVVVDFTRPNVVMGNLRKVLPLGVHCVVGTTGFKPADLEEVDALAKANNTGLLIAPNFALGAVVMMKLACEAAKYFSDVEIIEKHHDQKLDAPSGTAIITAQKIAEVRKAHKQGHPEEKETMAGVRGGDYEGIKIHSMRLAGYVASQEVVFGGQGETLKISTDPVSRECYMPGVALACKKICAHTGLVYGLDKLL